MTQTKQFEIPVVSPPGATLKALIDEWGMSQQEVSARLEKLPKDVSLFITGQLRVSADLADRLELVTGLSRDFWLRSQDNYDAYLKREAEVLSTKTLCRRWSCDKGRLDAAKTIMEGYRSVSLFFVLNHLLFNCVSLCMSAWYNDLFDIF